MGLASTIIRKALVLENLQDKVDITLLKPLMIVSSLINCPRNIASKKGKSCFKYKNQILNKCRLVHHPKSLDHGMTNQKTTKS